MKKGFTISEILITLGVIGVVAAITIPNLVKTYKKKVTVERLKVVYNQITQAVKLEEAENSDVSNWNFNQSHKAFFDQYLLKHIKILKETQINKLGNYKEMSGKVETRMAVAIYPQTIYTTINGTDIIVESSYNSRSINAVRLYIDINGVKNGPNQYGYDAFLILIDSNRNREHVYFHGKYSDVNNNEFSFVSEPNMDRDVLLGKKSPKSAKYNNLYPCNKNKIGTWCGRLIELDGWKISDDYPW